MGFYLIENDLMREFRDLSVDRSGSILYAMRYSVDSMITKREFVIDGLEEIGVSLERIEDGWAIHMEVSKQNYQSITLRTSFLLEELDCLNGGIALAQEGVGRFKNLIEYVNFMIDSLSIAYAKNETEHARDIVDKMVKPFYTNLHTDGAYESVLTNRERERITNFYDNVVGFHEKMVAEKKGFDSIDS